MKTVSTEDQILAATADLLEREGVAAVTTRAVCQAAGVTAPTLYHHFGDKNGLMCAVVARGIATFMARKRANHRTDDALADLKRSWDGWLALALERPMLFRLMVESAQSEPEAHQESFALMKGTVQRLADAGRLATGVEAAALTFWAATHGVLSLFMQGTPAAEIKASSELLFEAVAARLVRPAT